MADARHNFLESFATLLMSIRPDKWNKFMGSDETVAVLDEFFRQQDVLELVLGLNPAGQLQATPCFPPALRGKGVYFVKEKKENITQENYRSGLLVGDIGPSPLEHFITVVEEVGSPHGLVLEVGSKRHEITLTEEKLPQVPASQCLEVMMVTSPGFSCAPDPSLPPCGFKNPAKFHLPRPRSREMSEWIPLKLPINITTQRTAHSTQRLNLGNPMFLLSAGGFCWCTHCSHESWKSTGLRGLLTRNASAKPSALGWAAGGDAPARLHDALCHGRPDPAPSPRLCPLCS